MHPMFVKLFLENGADDMLAEEEDRRRTANRARRARLAARRRFSSSASTSSASFSRYNVTNIGCIASSSSPYPRQSP